MTKNENMFSLEEEVLDAVSGGVGAPGSVMICTADAPLYIANPAGGQNRNAPAVMDTVPAGTPVRIFEHGTQYSKVIANGKIGWTENVFLENKISL